LWSIPNGVDTDAFVPGRPAKRWDIAFVGRLNTQKDVGTLFDAVATLPGRRRVSLVGSGPERSALERRAAELNIDVTFLGVLPQDQVISVLQEAETFVLPSRFEGHPKALLEAMAVGMPWIGTDIPGIRDLASEPELQLVRVGSADELARSLATLLEDPALRERLGTEARRRVVQRFDLGALLADESVRLRRVVDALTRGGR
jgi:glycosyltransferase involved in cell wall biosynthesis